MQQSFKSFIEAIQTAVVESSESINKRNEKIINDYFNVDTEDVMLENDDYNKDLYEIISKFKAHEIFKNIEFRSLIFELVPPDEKDNIQIENIKGEDSVTELNEEDQLIFALIKYFYKKKDILFKQIATKTKLDEKSLFVVESNFNKIKFKSDEKKSEKDVLDLKLKELEEKRNFDNDLLNKLVEKLSAIKKWGDLLKSWLVSGINTKSETVQNELFKFNDFLEISENFDNLLRYELSFNEKRISLENQIKLINNNTKLFDKEIKVIKEQLNTLDTEINDLKIEYQEIEQNLSLTKEIILNLDKIKLYAEELSKIVKECLDKYLEINQLKSIDSNQNSSKKNKIENENENIISILKAVKRYKIKTIETLIPKTVRLNYPATYDYGTPGNDKDYKIVATPIEVPLLTLVPISSCNIEKAVLKANFKFDIDGDDVKIDFSNEKFLENETSSNFGSVEITLTPQQTPEGLKALIESYETFLKRQIV